MKSAIRLWRFDFVAGPRSGGLDTVVAKKNVDFTDTSDLTGKSESAGAERQPGVEHLRHALYLERAQQLVRVRNIAATFTMASTIQREPSRVRALQLNPMTSRLH